MLQVLSNTKESLATAFSVGSVGVDVDQARVAAVLCEVVNSAPAAGTFTASAATDLLTKTAHGFLTGLKVQVSNAGGALPGGLAAATDYFVINISANTFKLATTLANAQSGAAIDITTDGTGTQTVTPTALAGASVKLQGTLDSAVSALTVWFDLPAAASGDLTKSAAITATANIFLSDTDTGVNFVRAFYTLTAGQLAISQTVLVKGDI